MLLKIHLFLLLLFILTSMSLSSSSCFYSSRNLTCGIVPYPFGTAGIALPGFEIGCPKEDPGMPPWMSPPFLSISNNNYRIQKISLQGYIKIFVGPIYKRCFGANGKWTESEGSGRLNLSGTPFALSDKNNILTVVGCNNLVLIRRQGENLATTSGCITFCDPQGTLVGNSCSGLGCCQATLPGTLKSFNLQFMQVNISDSSADFINCSAAFFSQVDLYETDDFNSYQSGFCFPDFNLHEPHSYDNNIIQLDWVMGNKSCEASRNNIGSFACKNNSNCYDSPSMVGYLCNCTQGYEGNPYAIDGCKDIDECLESFNPCVGHCINLPGNYACPCPKGMTGDGKRGGSGCKRVFPLFGMAIVLGFGIAISILLLYLSIVKRIKLFEKRKQEKLKHKFFVQNQGLLLQQLIASHEDATQNMRILRLHDLEKATNRFDNALILGRGGHGEVYKGILSDQHVVAIKRSKIVDPAEIDEFINEVVILSQVNHRNIVKLYGCCLETEVPLLVYEFISNGTLFNHLHVEEHCSLTWKLRLRIALEAAGAISYLHSSAYISIFHRYIKSSNILLDDYFTAKVSDFGASRSVQIDQTGVTTAIQGTPGYLDPEYHVTGRLT